MLELLGLAAAVLFFLLFLLPLLIVGAYSAFKVWANILRGDL